MQAVVEEAIRWIGYLVLRIVTLGWYRGGKAGDQLPEGAIGLVTLALVTYLAFTLG